MSQASRHPRKTTQTIASYPPLVSASGTVNTAAVRREVRYLTRGPNPAWRWPAAAALTDTFQKVRLQRQWALKALTERAGDEARAAADRAAIETEALATAQRHRFDVTILNFHLTRHSVGSLADTNVAPHLRKVFRRAVEIACERAGASHLQAAE